MGNRETILQINNTETYCKNFKNNPFVKSKHKTTEGEEQMPAKIAVAAVIAAVAAGTVYFLIKIT